MKEHIAFIGLGHMGGPMALNLLAAGFALTAHDLSPAALRRVAERGARVADTAADAVREADVVISMLPASAHVRELYLGDGGVLAAARDGALLIDKDGRPRWTPATLDALTPAWIDAHFAAPWTTHPLADL